MEEDQVGHIDTLFCCYIHLCTLKTYHRLVRSLTALFPYSTSPFHFPAGFYVSGLNLTEDAAYILLHPFQNMRKMTMKALSLLLSWASEQQAGPKVGGVNIICCDFVGASQFCSLVIDLNYKLVGRTLRPVCRTPAPST